jgi:amino acid adenylation domain-containing protein
MTRINDIADRKAQLVSRRAGLSPAKLGRLEDVLQRGTAGDFNREMITRRPNDGPIPLSFAQQRLWFLDQLEPNRPLYNLSVALRLTGRLNLLGLEQSINEIIRRHESLRTNFISERGEPSQIIWPSRTLSLPVVDLHGLSQHERRDQARRLALEESLRSYSLEREALLRVTLIRVAEEEEWFLLTMHHIISDGWSISLFIGEMEKLYSAYSTGRPSPLPDLPIQYADYSYWQRQWLQGKVLEAELAYWRQQLDGISILDLPTDRPRPAVQTFRGVTKSLTLSDSLADGLRVLSKQEGMTLFILLLSVFGGVLSHYSGQEDITVGTPVMGRRHVETEGLIGFFVNTLVLRMNLTGNPSFRHLIARVREVVLGAQTHQDLPFERLVEELQPERSLSHGPLFEVMFQLNSARPGKPEVEGLVFTPLGFRHGDVKFDLTLAMTESKSGLYGFLSYKDDLFDAATIGRMAEHYCLLLERIVANPMQRLRAFPLLTEAQQHQLLVEWARFQAEHELDHCISKNIEMQVERTPDATAVVYEDHQLSYLELNRRANQLAHYLVGGSVKPDVRVALCIQRGLEMVIGLLGVLKAGGAYVPLDPSYPERRLSYILEDSQAQIILSQQCLVKALPQNRAQVVCMDRDWERIAQESRDNPGIEVKPENLAYVIYTSGSTGIPKGVAVQRGALVNLITAMARQPGLSAEGALLAVTSLSFDISMLEIYLPLVTGARMIVVGRESAADGNRLAQLLTTTGATHMQATPATWRVLMDSGWKVDPSLAVLCGGEALPRDLAGKLLDKSLQVWNLYGPTETTIWSTMSLLASDSEVMSIGRPIDNTQVYILDGVFQPVPIGVPGEIYVGGKGLARGYFHRPDLTAERFMADPFSQEAGGRCFRTGDLARYRYNGEIEFLGRVDYQMKIRGFRVEPGEIEAVLNQYPGIKQVAVVALEDQPGEHRLVAYVVENENLDRNNLREYVQSKLPNHLVPSAFVKMEQIPLTPNGKIDRRALPRPNLSVESIDDDPPDNAIEEILCGVWAEVLHLARVGPHRNFFELGGHSLLATRVISKIRDVFGVEIPLRALFENPTVAGLREIVERERQIDPDLRPPPIRRTDKEQGVPLSHAQRRLWLLDKLTSNSSIFNIPTALHFSGPLNLLVLENCLSEIIRRHEVLRTRFVEVGDQYLQVVTSPQPFKLMLIDLRHLPETKREVGCRRLAEEEARRPFDLPQGPHLRCRLLKIGDENHIILLTMHHIASDGWSMGLLIREITSLYKSFSQGIQSGLPELAIGYADFAAWESEWLRGEVLERGLRYWKQQLSGKLPSLNMPTDRPRPVVPSYRGGQQGVTISKETTFQIKMLSQKEGLTLFMTLLAAFDVLFHHYTGQEDLIVGTNIANRNRSEIEDIIGFFVNQLVLRVNLSGDPTFQGLLRRVRDVVLGAYDHQNLPFDKLVEVLSPERALNQAPLFQVKITLRNIPLIDEARGVAIDQRLEYRPFNAELSKTSALDMTLIASDTPAGLLCLLEYSADLFDDVTMARFLGHFETILNQVTRQPDIRLSRLVELINEADNRELIDQRNRVKEARRQKLKNYEPKPIGESKKKDGVGV